MKLSGLLGESDSDTEIEKAQGQDGSSSSEESNSSSSDDSSSDSSSESESDEEEEGEVQSKAEVLELGSSSKLDAVTAIPDLTPQTNVCETCRIVPARYTCPRCQQRTCSVDCIKLHKQLTKCNGKRDRTKYIPINKFTDQNLESDFGFLTEVDRSFTSTRKLRKVTCRQNRGRAKMVAMSKERLMVLQLLPDGMARRRENHTYINYKTNQLEWTVELRVPFDRKTKYLSRVCEERSWGKVLESYLHPNENNHVNKYDYASVFAKEEGNITLLLLAEGFPGGPYYFRLPFEEVVRDSLVSKVIVEFPVIYLVPKSELHSFPEPPKDRSDLVPIHPGVEIVLDGIEKVKVTPADNSMKRVPSTQSPPPRKRKSVGPSFMLEGDSSSDEEGMVIEQVPPSAPACETPLKGGLLEVPSVPHTPSLARIATVSESVASAEVEPTEEEMLQSLMQAIAADGLDS